MAIAVDLGRKATNKRKNSTYRIDDQFVSFPNTFGRFFSLPTTYVWSRNKIVSRDLMKRSAVVDKRHNYTIISLSMRSSAFP